MHDAVAHPLESDGSEEEDDEDNVRIDGRHVDDLRVLRDPLYYAHVHEDPEKKVSDLIKLHQIQSTNFIPGD